MAQRSNQRKARPSEGDKAPKEAIAANKAKGQAIIRPFTMQDLVDEYTSLASAEEREKFWKELDIRLEPLSDEQKALFALSCSKALDEVSASLAQTFAEIDRYVGAFKMQ